MEILDGSSVIVRADRYCAGIRVVTPFRGMFAVRDRLMDELYSWYIELDIRLADEA